MYTPKHCGCMPCRNGRPHRPQPTEGLVRVWMVAKWLNQPSKTLVYAINHHIEGVAVRSPSSRLDLSDPDLTYVLETLAAMFTPRVGLNAFEYAEYLERRIGRQQYRDRLSGGQVMRMWGRHLLGCFWMHRLTEVPA